MSERLITAAQSGKPALYVREEVSEERRALSHRMEDSDGRGQYFQTSSFYLSVCLRYDFSYISQLETVTGTTGDPPHPAVFTFRERILCLSSVVGVFLTHSGPTTQVPNKYMQTYSHLWMPGLSLACFQAAFLTWWLRLQRSHPLSDSSLCPPPSYLFSLPGSPAYPFFCLAIGRLALY